MSYQIEANRRYQLKGNSKDKTYVDISLAFTPSPVTKDITLLTNERAINNALKNIVMTLPSEVAFFRDFGSTTNLYLFDLIDEASAAMLQDEIKRAIEFNEPRVSFEVPIVESDLIPADINKEDLGVKVIARPEQNEYSVVIKYLITGTKNVFTLETLLTPTR